MLIVLEKLVIGETHLLNIFLPFILFLFLFVCLFVRKIVTTMVE